eukprot:498221-Rhodomonas_salina.1
MANQIQEPLIDKQWTGEGKNTFPSPFPWDENPWAVAQLVEIVRELQREEGRIRWAKVVVKFDEATCMVPGRTGKITINMVRHKWHKVKESTEAAAASGSGGSVPTQPSKK